MRTPKLSTTLLFLSTSGILLLTAVSLQDYVNRKAPEPYMDEIFHVRQAQTYCNGNYHIWDPKITTPPGLYVTSTILSKVPTQGIGCTTDSLRAHNLLFLTGTFAVLVVLLRTLHPRETSSKNSIVHAFTLSLFPISYFFHLVYYTDPGSTFLVLLAYLASLHGYHAGSAAIGLVAVTFRQTNVIWVMFIAGVAAMNMLSQRQPPSRTFNHIKMAQIDGPGGIWNLLSSFVVTAVSRFDVLLSTVWPYVCVGASFVGFVFWNKGIVLGDRSNHIATIHVPQLYYYISTLLGFSFLSCDIQGALSALAAQSNLVFLVSAVSTALFMGWTISKFTIEHPFLLADNRHYSFYIWKNIFRRHALSRYAVVPGYLFAFWACGRQLATSQPVILMILYLVLTVATLIPTPLFDFRYYIIPFLMYRIHITPPRTAVLVAEALIYILINLGTIYLFGERPFVWKSEQGALQRFMW
ncbi:alpha-1,2-glucosyltransferase ALG10-A-like protein [Powellomyces hirtus]|nr:alpha-1,2-glucosyltransferase ALG10-A-like protein [Powellomyces hirtus]